MYDYVFRMTAYENGQAVPDMDVFNDHEIQAIEDEIDELFGCRVGFWYDDYATLYIFCSESLCCTATRFFGPPTNARELTLIGDRLPVRVPGHPTLELQFENECF